MSLETRSIDGWNRRESNPHPRVASSLSSLWTTAPIGEKRRCTWRDSNPHLTASRTAATSEVGLHVREETEGVECTRRDSNPHLTASETAATTELGYACERRSRRQESHLLERAYETHAPLRPPREEGVL